MNYPKIAELLERKKMLDAEVVVALEGLKDKSVPLDDRWYAFGALDRAGLLQTDTYGDGMPSFLGPNIDLMDEMWVERHETRDYHSIYGDCIADHLMEEKNISQEKADIWREEVLSRGYGSFTYDW